MRRTPLSLLALAIFLVPLLALLFVVGPVDSLHRYYWMGQTDEFKYKDINKDSEMSLAESEFYSVQTNLLSSSGSLRPFVFADCDENGRLTWREYYNFWFTNDMPCENESFYRKLIQDMSHQYRSDNFPFPLVLPGRSTISDSPPMAEPVEYGLDANLMESDSLKHISIDCGSAAIGPLPANYDVYETGLVQFVDCEIDNHLDTLTVTSVLLEIRYLDEFGAISSANLKATNIPPEHASSIRVYLADGMTFEGVRVIGAGGMKT